MKHIKTNICVSLLLVGMLLGVATASAQVSFRPLGDTYSVACPDNAHSGCTMNWAFLLPDGTLGTFVEDDIQPGERIHVAWATTISAYTYLTVN